MTVERHWSYAGDPRPQLLCRHCRAESRDPEQPETGLCPECLDLAVWGAACDACERIPTGRESRGCAS